jgi:hypothetical protein
MPRPISRLMPLALPSDPNPEIMPIRYGSREQLAEIHNRYYGPLSPRSLERGWRLQWRVVNGRAVASVHEFLAEAQRRFDEAPAIRPVQRQIVEHPTA